tara:strand:+ start:1840 stop:2040 length:201 start_codon:yes stop_codon:yes gene_type:complete
MVGIRESKYTSGTADQHEAYEMLFERWEKVGEPQPAIGMSCWMVEVTGDMGRTMWLGIEEDGYTHS